MSEGQTDGVGDASASGRPVDDLETVTRLRRAREHLDEVEARIESEGEDAIEEATNAYRDASTLLDEYVDRATGTGRENFKAYVQLEGEFEALVENLPDSIHARAAFEDALDAIDKRRLKESDFERAEAALGPAAQYADLLDEREAAREDLEAARKAAMRRLKTIGEEIEHHERLLELASVDLDAPVEHLREPIETYNREIRQAFRNYRDGASAREVFAFLDRTRWYPFVEYVQPPEDLREYVESNSAGEHTVSELLEYTEYSRSKLAHHVDDADLLKRKVATQRTYLDRIDAGPLTIDWPPEPASVLRRRTRELIPFAARVAGEDAVATLRTVRELTYDPDYDRLQTAAEANDRLSPDERERLTDGRVEDELERLRAERARIQKTLEETAE